MAANLASLPNYTCLESIERTVRRPASKKLLFHDRIHIEVAFIEAKEVFSWPGAASFESDLLQKIPEAGVSGAGGFGGWTRALFGESDPGFSRAGECMAVDRRGLQFNFAVPIASSSYAVEVGGGKAILPYAGSVCVDPGTLDIMLLEVHAEQIPAPLAAMSETIHYGRSRIGGADFLLPQDHDVTVTDLEGKENRSLTRFTGCQAYTSQSSITFDTARTEAPVPPPAKVEERRIPAGVSLDLKLETPITFDESAVGDPITARLDRATNSSGGSIPKGAKVSGRILGLEQYFEPEKSFLVILEFSSLTFGDKRALFRAELTGPRLREDRHLETDGTATLTGMSAPATPSTPSGLDIEDSAPGTGAFRVHEGRLHLGRGLRMIWKTQSEKP